MSSASEPPTAPRFLFEDEHLLAVEKPSGMLSVPGKGPLAEGSLTDWVLARYADAKVVHRLDMSTSGILLFARGLESQRHLSRQFEQRKVFKEYQAVVSGSVAQESGDINAPMRADWPRRPLQMVDPVEGKPAQTHYQVLNRMIETGATRVRLHPLTGRSHQLRVHLAWIGHPIVGDALYAPADQMPASPRLLLHASRIEIQHPAGLGPIRIDSTVPF